MLIGSNAVAAVRDAAHRWYYRLNDVNHRNHLWARSKRAHGVRFRSYDALSRHCRDELLGALVDELRPGDVVYDVGANTGVYSLTAAASDPTVHAVAFEPNPHVAEQLRVNVSRNGFDGRVAVREAAVGDGSGKETFYVSSYDELGSLRAENARAWDATVVDEVTVPVERLDDVAAVGDLPPPDHLKIDVEGFGREALEGARELLATERPTVYFEPHDVDGEKGTDWLLDTFEEFGYERDRVAEGWVFSLRSGRDYPWNTRRDDPRDDRIPNSRLRD